MCAQPSSFPPAPPPRDIQVTQVEGAANTYRATERSSCTIGGVQKQVTITRTFTLDGQSLAQQPLNSIGEQKLDQIWHQMGRVAGLENLYYTGGTISLTKRSLDTSGQQPPDRQYQLIKSTQTGQSRDISQESVEHRQILQELTGIVSAVAQRTFQQMAPFATSVMIPPQEAGADRSPAVAAAVAASPDADVRSVRFQEPPSSDQAQSRGAGQAGMPSGGVFEFDEVRSGGQLTPSARADGRGFQDELGTRLQAQRDRSAGAQAQADTSQPLVAAAASGSTTGSSAPTKQTQVRPPRPSTVSPRSHPQSRPPQFQSSQSSATPPSTASNQPAMQSKPPEFRVPEASSQPQSADANNPLGKQIADAIKEADAQRKAAAAQQSAPRAIGDTQPTALDKSGAALDDAVREVQSAAEDRKAREKRETEAAEARRVEEASSAWLRDDDEVTFTVEDATATAAARESSARILRQEREAADKRLQQQHAPAAQRDQSQPTQQREPQTPSSSRSASPQSSRSESASPPASKGIFAQLGGAFVSAFSRAPAQKSAPLAPAQKSTPPAKPLTVTIAQETIHKDGLADHIFVYKEDESFKDTYRSIIQQYTSDTENRNALIKRLYSLEHQQTLTETEKDELVCILAVHFGAKNVEKARDIRRLALDDENKLMEKLLKKVEGHPCKTALEGIKPKYF